MRIGIDVGGTNTDAVLMDGLNVIATKKTPTTENVTDGIVEALRSVVESSSLDVSALDGVMIGTTHFTNAMVERRRLEPTACIRLGLPATVCLPPLVDWPDDLATTIGNHTYIAHGGHEFDGREISPLDEEEIRQAARDMLNKGVRGVAVSGVFSPETQAGKKKKVKAEAKESKHETSDNEEESEQEDNEEEATANAS